MVIFLWPKQKPSQSFLCFTKHSKGLLSFDNTGRFLWPVNGFFVDHNPHSLNQLKWTYIFLERCANLIFWLNERNYKTALWAELAWYWPVNTKLFIFFKVIKVNLQPDFKLNLKFEMLTIQALALQHSKGAASPSHYTVMIPWSTYSQR